MRERITAAETLSVFQRLGQRHALALRDGRRAEGRVAAVADPFPPLLDLWAAGYALEAVEGDEVALYARELADDAG